MLILFGYFLISVHFSAPFMCRLYLGCLPLVARSVACVVHMSAILTRVHFLQGLYCDIYTTKKRALSFASFDSLRFWTTYIYSNKCTENSR